MLFPARFKQKTTLQCSFALGTPKRITPPSLLRDAMPPLLDAKTMFLQACAVKTAGRANTQRAHVPLAEQKRRERLSNFICKYQKIKLIFFSQPAIISTVAD